MLNLTCFFVGIVAGIFSGFFGVGGGVVMIPSLIYFLGMTQHQAQGTTLAAILPPVFILAVWKYYQAGQVNVPVAVLMACGLMIGGLFGGTLVQGVSSLMLKRCFGALLIFIGFRMIFFR